MITLMGYTNLYSLFVFHKPSNGTRSSLYKIVIIRHLVFRFIFAANLACEFILMITKIKKFKAKKTQDLSLHMHGHWLKVNLNIF